MANKENVSTQIYDIWNEEKKILHNKEHNKIIFHEREVWWCSIGKNLGDEQDGKNKLFERPVLIVKKFNSKIAWVVPLTSQEKDGKYYYAFPFNGRNQVALLSQLKLISTKRMRRIISGIRYCDFWEIRKKLKELL